MGILSQRYNEQNATNTVNSQCEFRTYHGDTYDNRHNFQLAVASGGSPMMACTQCGETYMMGADRLWHRAGFGVDVIDLTTEQEQGVVSEDEE